MSIFDKFKRVAEKNNLKNIIIPTGTTEIKRRNLKTVRISILL